jgi:hypothetical protein
MTSYHFYATPSADQGRETQGFTAFEEAEHFLTGVRFIEAIRSRLSPTTGGMLNEIGMIADHLLTPDGRIPEHYWNLASAVYAYLWSRLAELGIDVVGESQLAGYPTQFPSVTMIDWTSGRPNARYWVLKLVKDAFGPGDTLVQTTVDSDRVHARAFVTRGGKRKLLLVNRRDLTVSVAVKGLEHATAAYVDGSTRDGIGAGEVAGGTMTLAPYAVAVVSVGPR